MKYATLFVDPPYQDNRIFNPDDTELNRDDCLRAYRTLRLRLNQYGIELTTQDKSVPKNALFTIYNDIPELFPPWHNPDTSIALLFETAVVKPYNWDIKNHDKFRYIFTWNDTIVDNKKYFKLFFAQPHLKVHENPLPFSQKKLVCLIASNKSSRHPNESYSERIKTIKWFEKYHPDDLDLYGKGWDMGIEPRSTRLRRSLGRRINALSPRVFFPNGTYHGSVESKYQTLSRYRFTICYENAVNIPGYITEKIFDCFISGVVPVYLGPPNISDYIPANTYIDRNSFRTHEQLFDRLNEITEYEFLEYRKNIDSFLRSETAEKFSCEYFADSIGKVAQLFFTK